MSAHGRVRSVRGAAITLAVLAASAIGGCRVPPRASGATAPAFGRETLITEAEIERMSVRTAWDVVRLRAPRLMYAPDESDRPTRVRLEAPRSVNSDETPLLVVDGQPMFDLEYLYQIPAPEVRVIRILSAEAAQPVYGLRAFGGAIVVETKRRP